MSNVRLRRLSADFAKLNEYVRRHPRVRLIQTHGDPPERYQFEYRIKSLRMVNGELTPVQSHLVEVTLPRNYPRTPPQCRMLSPVFHPNIAPHAICVGDHWSAGESLQSIVTRIGEMLAYQSYNVKSPLNGEAARWVEEHKHLVPLDTVSLLVEEESEKQPLAQEKIVDPSATPKGCDYAGPPSSLSASRAEQNSPDSEQQFKAAADNGRAISCPACGKSYRASASMAGRKVRCTKCFQVFEFPTTETSAS
jgi:predicted Zn finger-like uncharacterized protein